MNNKKIIKVLKAEIKSFKKKTKTEDTGHIHTTIQTLKDRILELKSK